MEISIESKEIQIDTNMKSKGTTEIQIEIGTTKKIIQKILVKSPDTESKVGRNVEKKPGICWSRE